MEVETILDNIQSYILNLNSVDASLKNEKKIKYFVELIDGNTLNFSEEVGTSSKFITEKINLIQQACADVLSSLKQDDEEVLKEKLMTLFKITNFSLDTFRKLLINDKNIKN